MLYSVQMCSKVCLVPSAFAHSLADSKPLMMDGNAGGAGLFERAMAMEKRSEKCYFIYAQYLDQLMRDARQRQEGAPKSAGTGRANPQDRLSGRSRCCFP